MASASKGAIPFVYLGGHYLITGASALPSVLTGKSWATIATSLHDPSNPVAKAVNGTANFITAAICKMTSNQPVQRLHLQRHRAAEPRADAISDDQQGDLRGGAAAAAAIVRSGGSSTGYCGRGPAPQHRG